MADTGTQQGAPAAAQQQSAPAPVDVGQLANSLLDALDNRNRRTENGVVRSYAQQYGMTEAEVSEILAKARNERNSKPTEAQQAQIDAALGKANERLVAAEVKAVGATLGLLDTDVALALIDRKKITVKDDGSVEGVKDALEALKASKSYLFGAKSEPAKKTGMRQTQGGGATGERSTESANDALRSLFGRKE